MGEVLVRALLEADKVHVLQLMKTDHLRTEGILEKGTRYWGAFDGDTLAGVIGCEYENEYGLLRTAMVSLAFRCRGIASLLTDVLLTEARTRGLKTVYLFSTDAGEYWQRLGFIPASVDEAVNRLSHTPQVMLFARLGWLPTEVAYQYNLDG